jgi:hypothetical protein
MPQYQAVMISGSKEIPFIMPSDSEPDALKAAQYFMEKKSLYNQLSDEETSGAQFIFPHIKEGSIRQVT